MEKNSAPYAGPVAGRPASCSTQHVLVVDDDARHRRQLVGYLENASFRVTEAEHGDVCLQRLEAEPLPDMLLIDLALPGLSGIALLREIRRRWPLEMLPVIVVSSASHVEDVVAALDAGANDYVAKPFELAVLAARIRSILRGIEDMSNLIDAERQRVMLESLGAACHHMAQPMSVASAQLQMALEDLGSVPDDLREKLGEASSYLRVASRILHRMQEVGEYRTVPYCENRRIVDLTPTEFSTQWSDEPEPDDPLEEAVAHGAV